MATAKLTPSRLRRFSSTFFRHAGGMFGPHAIVIMVRIAHGLSVQFGRALHWYAGFLALEHATPWFSSATAMG